MSRTARKPSGHRSGRLVPPLLVVGLMTLCIALLAAFPVAWARPSQAPDYQTVPTLTPTPRPGQPTDTPAPGEPTDTPEPGQPTDTPAPGQPTNTPVPGGPTTTATATVTGSPVAGVTPSPQATVPVVTSPANCLAVPTPGFQPATASAVDFRATSRQSLVVPGQTLNLQISATNKGSQPLKSVLICNPLNPALQAAQPRASQGQARLTAQGLVAELGDLPVGRTATVDIALTIPANQPLGGVIENQAWLFSNGQAASTSLLTWALPPAWLPPTGQR